METLKNLNNKTKEYFIDDFSRQLIQRNTLNNDGRHALDLYLKKQYNALIKYDLSDSLRLRELVVVLQKTLKLAPYIYPKTKPKKRTQLFEHNSSTYWIEELVLSNRFTPKNVFRVEGFGLFTNLQQAKEAIESRNC